MKKVVFLTLMIICLIIVEGKKINKQIRQYSQIVNFEGQVQMPLICSCNFSIKVGTKIIKILLICKNNNKQQNLTYSAHINSSMGSFQIYEHFYLLENIYIIQQKEQNLWQQQKLGLVQNSQRANYIKRIVDTGLNWQYQIKINSKYGQMLLSGQKQQYKDIIILILGIYTLIAFLTLPPKQIFYNYMSGVPGFSMLVSIHLTFAIIIINMLTLVKYIMSLNNNISIQVLLYIILFIIFLVCHIMHFTKKIKVFINIVSQYKIKYKKQLMLISFFYFMIVFLILSLSSKTWITYGYYAFGLIYYMLSSVIFNTFKKHRFSFRMILFDCISILALALCSKFYPSLNYQIPTHYQLISIFIMLILLLLTGGLIFIMVKVIKGDIKPEIKSKKLKNNQKSILNVQMNWIQTKLSKKVSLDSGKQTQFNEGKNYQGMKSAQSHANFKQQFQT